jgi:myo-inositol-1(or 4)-monophosphatase
MAQSFDHHFALKISMNAAKAAEKLLQKKQKDLLRHGYASIGVGTKSDPSDFATDADREAQKAIVAIIAASFPDHRFLGEEGDTDHLGNPTSPYRWIIDPLDGTTNFIHGKPNYGTIIALQNNGETILGVMTRPHFGETYTAIKGEGCYFNGKRIESLRKTLGMDDAILCCNIMKRAEKFPDGRLMVSIPRCAMIENYSNAVEEFTVTLRGWNDGMFFDGPRLWDAAAGCLMIEECGGKARMELKDPEDDRGGIRCVATTKKIFSEVEAFVFKT